jgi:hypothetical protein
VESPVHETEVYLRKSDVCWTVHCAVCGTIHEGSIWHASALVIAERHEHDQEALERAQATQPPLP